MCVALSCIWHSWRLRLHSYTRGKEEKLEDLVLEGLNSMLHEKNGIGIGGPCFLISCDSRISMHHYTSHELPILPKSCMWTTNDLILHHTMVPHWWLQACNSCAYHGIIMVEEPTHLVGKTRYKQCGSQDICFKYYNNKKENLPQYYWNI